MLFGHWFPPHVAVFCLTGLYRDAEGAYPCYIIQSTLIISKSKGPSETLRDIRTSTYQICRIEENTNRTTEFHK